MTGDSSGRVAEHARVVERTQLLLDAVRDVTLEDFRSEDANFERHSRLGRELLYLLANNGWSRRTTEVVDVGHAWAIDTVVIVDVDLTYADHEAFRSDAGIVWLPLLALPPMQDQKHQDQDQIAGLEVSDAAAARVPKLPEAEVHQRLAAALAEIILNVMAGRAQQEGTARPPLERAHKLLLSAAIRRLLPGPGTRPTERGGTVPAGLRVARARLEQALARDIAVAEAMAEAAGDGPEPEGTHADDLEGDRAGPWSGAARPVLGSHVGEILNALIGTALVVVAVEDPGHPISYTVRMPSRRLTRQGRSSMWLQPRALLSIDLLAPTAHADRLIRVRLPDGVICHDGNAGVTGRIEVVLPAPFERLDTLMRRLFPPSLPADRPASWVDGRIAEMAQHKVDAALDSLQHYTVTATRGRPAGLDDPQIEDDVSHPPSAGAPPTARGSEWWTLLVDARLRRLRDELVAVRRSGSTPVAMAGLRDCWDGGSWFPRLMRRRVSVDTASPDVVMLRAAAVDDVALRARPTTARIDIDVSVFDSQVFNVARYAGALNMIVLAVLAALLIWDPPHSNPGLQRDLLATILTLFSAVQASRVEHPDGSTLRGLLSRASYWIMLGSVLPTVLLAMALAVVPLEHCDTAAVIALVLQGLVMFRLRRGPLSQWRRRRPRIALVTGSGPDHARVDVLRGTRSRALVTEALTLGREAFGYVVTRPTGQDQFTGLLERGPSSPAGRVEERIVRVTARASRLLAAGGVELPRSSTGAGGPPAANLLGVVQSATAGQAITYLVFRERPTSAWLAPGGGAEGAVVPVALDPDRLAPMEPPEWVLEVLVGIPEPVATTALADHPLMAIVTDTRRHNFRVLAIQLPAPPPPDGSGRRWMRMRIGVSYRRGDSLRGLGSFLHRLHRLDGQATGAGTLSVIVRVNAERVPAPSGDGSRPLSDRDFDVVPDPEAAADPTPSWRVLAITAQSRIGLLHDVLAAVAGQLPSFQLAGLTSAAVYGQTVIFMVGRDPLAGGPAGPAQAAESLATALPRLVRDSDRLVVAVDQRLAARALDGTAGAGDRLLLQVGLRAPDRPGVLRETLRDLRAALAEHAPAGIALTGVDVWFVLLQVVNGRTTRGRLTVRLPGGPAHWGRWTAVDWAAVERSMSRAAAMATAAEAGAGALAWSAAAPDDTVITADLLRVALPSTTATPAGTG